MYWNGLVRTEQKKTLSFKEYDNGVVDSFIWHYLPQFSILIAEVLSCTYRKYTSFSS